MVLIPQILQPLCHRAAEGRKSCIISQIKDGPPSKSMRESLRFCDILAKNTTNMYLFRGLYFTDWMSRKIWVPAGKLQAT
jgi:hypothetical protein